MFTHISILYILEFTLVFGVILDFMLHVTFIDRQDMTSLLSRAHANSWCTKKDEYEYNAII